MKKALFSLSILVVLVIPVLTIGSNQDTEINMAVESEEYSPIAKRGCCSWHDGVCGCNAYGEVECCDGTISPSCTCNAPTPEGPFGLQENDCDTDITLAQGTTYVRPYVRKDGTFVQGHYRTNLDGNQLNNWSTRGNANPYTGQKGYRDPYPTYDSNLSRDLKRLR